MRLSETAAAVLRLVSVFGLVSQVASSPARRPARADVAYQVNSTRADAVKAAFQTSWDGYYKYALGHDELLPVSNRFNDDLGGWGASVVDALSTALVMGKWDVVEQILEFVPTIDYNNTSEQISLFETTIRHLGGLLSAYDLLTGPLQGQVKNTTAVAALLSQAKRLADNLKVAFDTPTGIPDNSLHFGPARRAGSSTNGLATIGSLVLEWTRLSDITGDDEYGSLAQKGESYLLDPKPAVGEPFPGLLGTNVDISTGLFLDGSGGWVGGDDSFYEYLIKMHLYDPDRFGQYKSRWIAAVESSITHLASHPTTRPDLTFLAAYQGMNLSFVSQHLACFDGGNIILGGLVLDEPRYVDFGLELVSACYATYSQTATGIGPEQFSWQDGALPASAGNNPGPPAGAQASFYQDAGFWITSAGYVLRPEVLESIYYAYRATGDAKYQQWAWDAFVSINASCRAGSGYSVIDDVNTPGGGGFGDFQESFWFAEVLKYSYLIHAEDSDWQVKADHSNKFVFNTEAHPVRIATGGGQ